MREPMKGSYRGFVKLNGGPGGIACPCCGFGCHPRKAKPLMRRFVRRKVKQELKGEQRD